MSLIKEYYEFLELKQLGFQVKARALADELVIKYNEKPDYSFILKICEMCHHKIDHIIWKKIILPELERRIEYDPLAIKAMILTIQNLYSSKPDHERLDYITEERLTIKLIKINPNDEWAINRRITQLRRWLSYTIHEWPSGVLYGMDGASVDECDEILSAVSDLLSLDPTGQSDELCKDVQEKTLQYRDRPANKTVRGTESIVDSGPDPASFSRPNRPF